MKRTLNSSRDDDVMKKIRRYEQKIKKQRLKLRTTIEDSPEELPPDSPLLFEIEPQPGSSQVVNNSTEIAVEQNNYEETENTVPGDTLPEEFLLALGDEGKTTEQKGDNIRQEIVNRWENIIKMGIPKENWPKLINKFLTPGNFPRAIAPKLNPELVTTLSDNILKRDKKFEYRQNLIGKVLSSLGYMLTDIMKGNLNSLKLIEGINDAAKVLCNMNRYDNIVRKHFATSSFEQNLKKAIANTQPDSYLFGEGLGERLKTAKAMARDGSVVKKQTPKFNNNLNWKGPAQKFPQRENRTRGGPRNHQPYQQQQQYQQQYQQHQQYRRPSPKFQQPRAPRRR